MRKISYPTNRNFFGHALTFFSAALFLSIGSAHAARTVDLEWDASPDATVVGYRVLYGNSSGSYPLNADAQGTTTAQISGLAEDQEYFFVVTAYNAAGLASAPSNEVVLPVAISPEPNPTSPEPTDPEPTVPEPTIPDTETTNTTYEQWLAENPVGNDIAPTADPDHDGLNNFAEYAMGLSPTASLETPLMDLQAQNEILTVRFAHPSNRTDVQYILQESADLVAWTTVTDGAAETSEGRQTVTIQRDIRGYSRLFYRLLLNGQAGSATLPPYGVMSTVISGTSSATGTVATSMFGLAVTRPPIYSGSAETIGSDTLTDVEATWTDGAFDGSEGACLLEITSGPAIGTTYDIIATSARTKTIRVAQPLAPGAGADFTYEVRKHWTLASLFGPQNEAGLVRGGDEGGDRVRIENGGTPDRYYFASAAEGSGWRKVGEPAVDQADAVLYPEDGIALQRRNTMSQMYHVVGRVKTWSTSVPVLPGMSVLGNVVPAPMTLNSSNLYTGNANTGVKNGNDDNADRVLLWTGTYYRSFYYKGNAGWREIGGRGNAGDTIIPAGGTVTVLRNGSNGFNWVVPVHPAGL